MKISDIVYKIYNNIVTEFIIVYVQSEDSIHPYGIFGWDSSEKYGVVVLDEFNKEKENSGISRKDNPLPYVYVVRGKEIFKTKEELLKSLM